MRRGKRIGRPILGLVLSCIGLASEPTRAAPNLTTSAAANVQTTRPAMFAPTPSGSSAETLLLATIRADRDLSLSVQRLAVARSRQLLASAAAVAGRYSHPYDRAERLFEELHSRVLVGDFRATCGSLEATLSQGHYNCLTATVLYLACCRAAGLEATAVASPNHVQVALNLPTTRYLIELTDPTWSPLAFESLSGRQSEISDVALLARIHYNLGIAYAQRGEYAWAAEVTQQGLGLDPTHQPTRANLLAIFNNWCLDLLQKGDVPQAVRVVQQGLQIDPDYPPLRHCADHLQSQIPTLSRP